MKRQRSVLAAVSCGGWLALASIATGGMPAPLPSEWTQHSSTPLDQAAAADSNWMAPHLQAISFFLAGLLVCAWAVRGLWAVLRKDLAWLPPLSFGRALSLVVLWGLLFVVVLTMISGARELMTPGAWRKQGWTYRLTEPASGTMDPAAERRVGLETLRFALWQYAAAHEGRFPPKGEASIDPALWTIPGKPGLQFEYVVSRTADESGRVLVYEPELAGEERQVLLTNGMIGTMRTADILKATQLASGR